METDLTKRDELRKRVMLGNLPNDFLRLPVEDASLNSENASAIFQPCHLPEHVSYPGRLQITFVSAFFKKNYGMMKMDPYVRMRFGYHVYETHTCVSGGKSPHWNKTFHIFNVSKQDNVVHVDIYDEHSFSDDERIAWTKVQIPNSVWQGNVVDEWYPLDGKLGIKQEGSINVNFHYSNTPMPIAQPVMMVYPSYYSYPGYTQVPVYTLPPPHPVSRPKVEIKKEDLAQLKEMFPSIEEEIINSVLEASQGNKEVAINSLLEMQET